jgi:outer membrane murein-binding lipoprotein Lpp
MSMNKFLLATGVVATVTLQGCSDGADESKLATDATAELKTIQEAADKKFKRAAPTDAPVMTYFCGAGETGANTDDEKKGYVAFVKEEIEKISKDDTKKSMMPFIGIDSFAEFACMKQPEKATKAQSENFTKVLKDELKLEAKAKTAEKKEQTAEEKKAAEEKAKADKAEADKKAKPVKPVKPVEPVKADETDKTDKTGTQNTLRVN